MAKLSVSKTELGGSNPSAPASFWKDIRIVAVGQKKREERKARGEERLY